MDRYLVRFTSLSTLRVLGSPEFNVLNVHLILADDPTFDPHTSPWPNRFATTAIISAESIDEAVESVSRATEFVNGMLVLSTSANIDICKFDRAIEFNDGTHDRILIQQLEIPIYTPTARFLDLGKFEFFHDALNDSNNEILISSEERFARAVRWYRKGIMEDELFDTFQNYWTALETLKIILNEKYNVSNKYKAEYRCEFCGKGRQVPTEAGIQRLIANAGYPPDLWRELRSVRVQITHGVGSLSDITIRAQAILPKLRRLVIYGLLEVLNIPDGDKEGFLKEPNTAVGYPLVKITATLESIPIDHLSFDCMPQLIIQNPQIIRAGIFDTEASISFLFDYHPYKHRITHIKMELFGREDPESPLSYNWER